MTKIYKATKKGHSVLGVLPAYIPLYASRGYTVYSCDVKPGEVFREYEAVWKVEKEPTANHEGRLDAPQDILFPKEAAKAGATIKDVNVGMPQPAGRLGMLGVLLVCFLVLWYFLLGNMRRG